MSTKTADLKSHVSLFLRSCLRCYHLNFTDTRLRFDMRFFAVYSRDKFPAVYGKNCFEFRPFKLRNWTNMAAPFFVVERGNVLLNLLKQLHHWGKTCVIRKPFCLSIASRPNRAEAVMAILLQEVWSWVEKLIPQGLVESRSSWVKQYRQGTWSLDDPSLVWRKNVSNLSMYAGFLFSL